MRGVLAEKHGKEHKKHDLSSDPQSNMCTLQGVCKTVYSLWRLLRKYYSLCLYFIMSAFI